MTKDIAIASWGVAMKACADLGDGWRLPTKVELKLLHENKEKIGGFGNGRVYWSSTKWKNGNAAWVLVFGTLGTGAVEDTYQIHWVRAVRDI